MKKSDIALIVLVASFSVGIAFVIANSLPFLKIDEKGVVVKTAEPIDGDVGEVSKKVFNKDAINPTVETYIGGSDNSE